MKKSDMKIKKKKMKKDQNSSKRILSKKTTNVSKEKSGLSRKKARRKKIIEKASKVTRTKIVESFEESMACRSMPMLVEVVKLKEIKAKKITNDYQRLRFVRSLEIGNKEVILGMLLTSTKNEIHKLISFFDKGELDLIKLKKEIDSEKLIELKNVGRSYLSYLNTNNLKDLCKLLKICDFTNINFIVDKVTRGVSGLINDVTKQVFPKGDKLLKILAFYKLTNFVESALDLTLTQKKWAIILLIGVLMDQMRQMCDCK